MPSRHVTSTIVLLAASTLFGARATEAQTQPGFFSPGGRTLFDLDLASTPVGSVPSVLSFDQSDQSRPGRPTVVMKDGKRMLKATEVSEFVINLNVNLPEVFTLEFDIIPKACCNPEDLSFEGTRKTSRSAASAHIVWHPATIIVAGGGTMFQTAMPPDLSEMLASTPTTVAASFNGGTLALFTNGRLLFTLNNRKFIRGRVLRVFLGAQEGEAYAVYLSRLRIAEGGGVVASAPTSGTVAPSGASSTIATGSGSLTPPTVAGVTASVDAQGKTTVAWQALQGATSYFVLRWLDGDALCCNNTSPAQGIPGLTWQDAVLPKAGKYGYRVYANTPSGAYSGQTSVDYKPATTTVGVLTAVPGSQPAPVIAGIKGPDTTIALFNIQPSMPIGILIAWTTVPGAASYRVYRTTPTEVGLLRGTVSASAPTYMGNAGTAVAVDPEVTADALKFQYWVEAVFADGSRSDPGPIASVNAQGSSTWIGFSPVPPGVAATVGGTMTITWNGQQTRGNRVTWNWESDVTKVPVYVWFIEVDVAQTMTPFGPAFSIYRSGPVQVQAASPIPYLISGIPGPPYSLTLPAGSYVRFCVSMFPITDMQRQSANGCTASQLPP